MGPAARVSQGRASSRSRDKFGSIHKDLVARSPFGEARLGIPLSRHPLIKLKYIVNSF